MKQKEEKSSTSSFKRGQTKAIIFDSGIMITFSMNSMLNLFRDLKKNFGGRFLITRDVEREIITKPMGIKKYKFGAMRIKRLIDEGVLEFPDSVGISKEEIALKSKEYLKKANNLFYRGDVALKLIDSGEASCLALSDLLKEKGFETVIAVDERTTRMLFEKPENLKKLMEMKLHTQITMKGEVAENDFKFIRSTELIYVAHKKGLIKDSSADLLDAMLYAAKFRGTAVSDAEIR